MTENFILAIPKSIDEYNPMQDLYHTTQMIVRHCAQETTALGDEKTGILRSIIKACHKKTYPDLKVAIKDFNEAMKDLKASGFFKQGVIAQFSLITHILEQSYARSVAPYAHELNQYEGFSNNVYGEIKADFVHELIGQLGIKSHHVFLDMGSGIGNVVLQIAAECLCESYGIEIMENPARLGKKQQLEFEARMRFYGKACGPIVLKQGDFLEDEEIHQVIARADFIFVNKYF